MLFKNTLKHVIISTLMVLVDSIRIVFAHVLRLSTLPLTNIYTSGIGQFLNCVAIVDSFAGMARLAFYLFSPNSFNEINQT